MKSKTPSKEELFRDHHFKKVGMRLKELRLLEGKSQGDLDQKLKFPTHTYRRFEIGDGGNSKLLLAIIQHYADLGYNLNWILLEDNKNQFKKEQNITVNIDLQRAEEYLNDANENLAKARKMMKKLI